MKKCSKCKAIKPIEEFYKNHTRPDGRSYLCQVCEKAAYKKYYYEQRPIVQAKRKADYEKKFGKPYKSRKEICDKIAERCGC